MQLNELTSAIIGAAIKLHCALGPGLLESAYRICLAYELKKLGLRVEQEKPIPVIYEEVKLECGFRADLLVDGLVIVECKAKDKLHPVDQAQLTSHLRLLDPRVGLLVNFHEVVLKNGIKRIVNNYQESQPTGSGPPSPRSLRPLRLKQELHPPTPLRERRPERRGARTR